MRHRRMIALCCSFMVFCGTMLPVTEAAAAESTGRSPKYELEATYDEPEEPWYWNMAQELADGFPLVEQWCDMGPFSEVWQYETSLQTISDLLYGAQYDDQETRLQNVQSVLSWTKVSLKDQQAVPRNVGCMLLLYDLWLRYPTNGYYLQQPFDDLDCEPVKQYSDVYSVRDMDDWMACAWALGVIEGSCDGMAEPDEPLTNAQFVVMLYREQSLKNEIEQQNGGLTTLVTKLQPKNIQKRFQVNLVQVEDVNRQLLELNDLEYALSLFPENVLKVAEEVGLYVNIIDQNSDVYQQDKTASLNGAEIAGLFSVDSVTGPEIRAYVKDTMEKFSPYLSGSGGKHSTFVHEFGHFIQHGMYDNEQRKEWDRIFENNQHEVDEVCTLVGRDYGKTNSGEFFAETVKLLSNYGNNMDGLEVLRDSFPVVYQYVTQGFDPLWVKMQQDGLELPALQVRSETILNSQWYQDLQDARNSCLVTPTLRYVEKGQSIHGLDLPN